jgi:dethiobiotin synthetase
VSELLVNSSAPRGLFVTGTDTGVGKTHVASIILRELQASGVRTGAYKPVCSGAVLNAAGQPTWDDIERLTAALARPEWAQLVGPQRFLAPLAPPLAARAEGRAIDRAMLDVGLHAWSHHCDGLVIEGAGGWFCPLTDTQTFADWVTRWRWPVLIVARRGLGTINHTLLTIAAIRAAGVPLIGVVLNDSDSEQADLSIGGNPIEIEARTGVPVFGEVRYGATRIERQGRPVRLHWAQLMGGGDAGTMPHQA